MRRCKGRMNELGDGWTEGRERERGGKEGEKVTVKLEHTKSAESPIRGCSVVQQVHLLFQLRDLELMGTRSLPIPGLCQPRSSPEP